MGKKALARKLITTALTDGIEKLLAQGVDVNSRGKAGVTAYQAALLRGERETAQLLADHGARTNAPMPPAERSTKQFTAAAIMKLQEEGKLSVTNTLSKYFPDFTRGEEVTGESYGDWLRRESFEPLGMAGTGMPRFGSRLEQEALGYQFAAGKFTEALDWNMSWLA